MIHNIYIFLHPYYTVIIENIKWVMTWLFYLYFKLKLAGCFNYTKTSYMSKYQDNFDCSCNIIAFNQKSISSVSY